MVRFRALYANFMLFMCQFPAYMSVKYIQMTVLVTFITAQEQYTPSSIFNQYPRYAKYSIMDQNPAFPLQFCWFRIPRFDIVEFRSTFEIFSGAPVSSPEERGNSHKLLPLINPLKHSTQEPQLHLS